MMQISIPPRTLRCLSQSRTVFQAERGAGRLFVVDLGDEGNEEDEEKEVNEEAAAVAPLIVDLLACFSSLETASSPPSFFV